MFITVHAAAGALIGEQTKSIPFAFVLGFLSHFVMDAIPHGDQNLLDDITDRKKKALKLFQFGVIDGTVMSAVLFTLYTQGYITAPLPALAGALGAILPDVISGLSYFIKNKILQFIHGVNDSVHYILNGFTVQMPAGMVIQLITLAGLLYLFVLS